MIKGNSDEQKPPPGTHNTDEHLILLQEKMRQQKKLKQPHQKETELVRREKGFTLYVNGANAGMTHGAGLFSETGGKTARVVQPKTSRVKLYDAETEHPKTRAKTAPTAGIRRRQWQVASVDLKTCSGDRVKLKAPIDSATSVAYAEDFEDDCSDDDDDADDDVRSDEYDLSEESAESAEEDSEVEEHLEVDDKFNVEKSRIGKTVLRCNVSDVKRLRESLELRTSMVVKGLGKSHDNAISLSRVLDLKQSNVRPTGDGILNENPRKPDSSDGIDNLLQKIMKLDLRSQQRLLKVLGELDGSPRKSTAWTHRDNEPSSVTKAPDSGVPPARLELSSSVGEDRSRILLRHAMDVDKRPRDSHRSTRTDMETNDRRLPAAESKESNDSKHNVPSATSKGKNDKVNVPASTSKSYVRNSPGLIGSCEVRIELLSNWGHPRVIGLTELEVLDQDGKKIEILPSKDVICSVNSAYGSSNDIDVLFNGKSKTKKERHMWSCGADRLPVCITIQAVNRQHVQNFSVTALRIWNYNRSPSDLSAGARNVRVIVNDRLAFEGELSRGVANQIFEYDQTIPLNALKVEEKVVTPCSSVHKQSPREKSVQSSDVTSNTENAKDSSHSFLNDEHVTSSKMSSARHRHRERVAQSRRNDVIASEGDMECSAVAPSIVVSRTGKSPLQPSQDCSKTKLKLDNLDVSDVSLSTRLPPWLEADSDTARPTSSGKQQGGEKENLLDNWPSPRGECHLPTLLDVADTGLTQSAGESDYLEEAPLPKMKVIESVRAQRRKRQNFSLEESWTSLDLFNRCQRGRISIDIQDDILDEYLIPEKSKPSVPTIPEAVIAPQTPLNAEDFTVPELPYGQNLVVGIRTTWGDRHYVGLNGIEIFADNGQPVSIAKITADPSDINVLPEYTKDPRVVTNLIDGVNRTQDDTHMWLAPFMSGKLHYVYMTFDQPACISMMRIWNYNKSRIHSSRGAKDIEIRLDGVTIFVGEIARACGCMTGSSEAFGDTILFTMDDDILELVAQNDQAFKIDAADNLEDLDNVDERPSTADRATNETERPVTCAASRLRKNGGDADQRGRAGSGGTPGFHGQRLVLDLVSTWGDQHYIGLTGLELLGRDGNIIPLKISMIDAEPRDLHHLSGHEDDDRTLDKLIDGENVTMSDEHMWLIPFTNGNSHQVKISFGQSTQLTAIRVWNYNKSPEDTFRGVNTMHVTLDGRLLSPPEGFLIRKGPGNCFFDFAQQINFGGGSSVKSVPVPKNVSSRTKLSNEEGDGDVVLRPRGFIYQFQLLSSWADPYYVGLNGIEFYDPQGNLLVLTDANIAAYPDSVNVLNQVSNDVRTPDKLVDGVNDTTDGRHMWIAPILPGIVNRVYVVFDEPVELSLIKIWNYGKTPARGVRDIALLVDDLLVYNGTMEMAQSNSSRRGVKLPRYHTIRFTDSVELAMLEKPEVPCIDIEEQQIRLMNDRKLIASQSSGGSSRGNSAKTPDPVLSEDRDLFVADLVKVFQRLEVNVKGMEVWARKHESVCDGGFEDLWFGGKISAGQTAIEKGVEADYMHAAK